MHSVRDYIYSHFIHHTNDTQRYSPLISTGRV